ncbi:hypothetical protein O181_129556 [Austropuccinia psidii MF-1]|uniref:Uncharacterized protein n=1 Tax=Austropuccinia psidii MF-1 TaxID=1389203 RepID=A0A9Q3L117_9BASI|nr:hypothetical protein [Austropuccinia psidii MF-1]
MEATIQSNRMDADKEEARSNPEVSNLSQERHIWRMPELPPIPQAPEVSKDKPKGPKKKKKKKKKKGPKNHQGKGKGKANWNRHYPQGYRISKLEPSAMDSVLNMAGTLMEFTAKEKERMNRTFPRK